MCAGYNAAQSGCGDGAQQEGCWFLMDHLYTHITVHNQCNLLLHRSKCNASYFPDQTEKKSSDFLFHSLAWLELCHVWMAYSEGNGLVGEV